MKLIQDKIPTNVITGFLGVGKTTLIQQLLKVKPSNESWAILVNEFGEIGIDAALVQGDTSDGVFVREIPGGCLCCAAGVPVEVALNQLISKAKPDRLLIEPTGLGHPKEIIKMIRGSRYKQLLSSKATLTLVDARKTQDTRYTNHQTFLQQLEVADVVIANKSDLYSEGDLESLTSFLTTKGISPQQVIQTRHGQIDPSILDGNSDSESEESPDVTASSLATFPLDAAESGTPFPPEGYFRKEKSSDGYSACGWVFESKHEFNCLALHSLLMSFSCERIKASVKTDYGEFGFNLADGVLTQISLQGLTDSRVEFIDMRHYNWAEVEQQLVSTLIRKEPV